MLFRSERIILGLPDLNHGIPDKLHLFYSSFSSNIITMSLESAELAKLSINFFLAADVTVTNILASLSETTGASWSDIRLALQSDQRIGRFRYLHPGLGISGGNLPRDIASLETLMFSQSIPSTSFFTAIRQLSNFSKSWPFEVFIRYGLRSDIHESILIIGYGYKAGSDSIYGSPSIQLIDSLLDIDSMHKNIYIYDETSHVNSFQHPTVRNVRSDETGIFSEISTVFYMYHSEKNFAYFQRISKYLVPGTLIIDACGKLKSIFVDRVDLQYISRGEGF